MFFANSQNQFQAVIPVASLLSDAEVYGEFGVGDYGFPTSAAYRKSLRRVGSVWLASRSAGPYLRSSMRYFFDQFVLAHGYYEAALRWLSKLSPSVVVLANDHNLQHRAIIRAALQFGVPTVYLQHAAVTRRFPALATDFALLDGEDALEKYAEIGGGATTVYLTGSAKVDELMKCRFPAKNSIGICTNRLDSLEPVEAICRTLREAFPQHEIVLRLHPSDKREMQWRAVTERAGIGLASREQSVAEFLAGVGVVIAGGSGILMEAALAGAVAINFAFQPDFFDVYGFVASGVIPSTDDAGKLVRLIKSSNDREPVAPALLRRYHATYGTPYHGRSPELAASIIQSIAAGVVTASTEWRLADDTRMTVFRLASTADDNPQLGLWC